MALSPETPDKELRGIVLEEFYVHRKGPRVSLRELDLPDEIRSDAGRICEQLADDNLIDWRSVKLRGGHIVNGHGKITSHGVKVIEGVERPATPVTVIGDHNIVGDANIQVGNITIGQIARSISEASVPTETKEEARSLITKAFEHPAVKAVLGTLAESITKGLVTSISGGT